MHPASRAEVHVYYGAVLTDPRQLGLDLGLVRMPCTEHYWECGGFLCRTERTIWFRVKSAV